MASSGGSARDRARSAIAALIESPEKARSLLPTVVGMLDHEDRQVRLSAACGACLVGTAEPDLVEYLVRRLVDRLHDERTRAEAVFAFEYLATQFPRPVDEALQEIREEEDREPLAYTRTGGFRRSDVYSQSVDRSGVGRTRIAGSGTDPGPQQVYSGDDETEAGRENGQRAPDDDHEADDERDREAGADDGSGTAGADSEQNGIGRQPGRNWAIESETLDSIVEASVFGELTVLAGRERGEYADIYRTLGLISGREQAVGLRLFYRPEEDDRAAFLTAMQEALSAWAAVDADHVLSVRDWGLEPRPWAAVAYADGTLADRGRLSADVAVWNALRIVRAVGTLHGNGIVHGGLDPNAVAYTGNVIEDERTAPLVDNVGLLEAFRYAVDPATCLDPRYAAPEYFDAAYGGVDHATDIYHLGAICYRLFTGRPPYDSDVRDIGERVLNATPTPPSERVETVPGIVDQVVAKAMATQKLTRYETVAQMEQDLLRARSHLGDDG